MTTEIPSELIEKSLALCGKEIEDMYIIYDDPDYYTPLKDLFSIEKFAYYLISEEFIDAYEIKVRSHTQNLNDFVYAIRNYQKGSPEPLIELLKKI
jgi:hypothetical protein